VFALKRLTSKYNITQRWVPGHAGVKGNEKAEQLVNEGSASDTYFIGPEPFGYDNTKRKLMLEE
jgi:ribonuclease HI